MKRKLVPKVNILKKYIPFKGGLDITTPMLQRKRGKLKKSKNIYQDINDGYRTMSGYEGFDGRTAPSSGIYSTLVCTITGSVSAGDILSNVGVTIYGTVLAVETNYVVLTKITCIVICFKVFNILLFTWTRF